MRRRPFERFRCRKAIDYQQALTDVFTEGVGVWYLWAPEDAPDGTLEWVTPGFYWRPRPDYSIQLLGVTWQQAGARVRKIRRQAGVGPEKVDPMVVLNGALMVLTTGLAVAGDVVDLGNGVKSLFSTPPK